MRLLARAAFFIKTKLMEIPKIREEETLTAWRDRIAEQFQLSQQMQEILREVSVESYIHGTNVVLDTLKKEGRI